ncbi:MAG TPA: DUF1565 domain-containing protein [bacterium]|nr:DUF1565 domain-containing protein [bacterium]
MKLFPAHKAYFYRICRSVLCLLFVSGTLFGANLYVVSTSGSDSDPGTPERPFRSINYGVSRCEPGDTLEIRGGVYYELVNRFSHSGTPDQWITIRSRRGERAVIDGNGQWTVIQFHGKSYYHFQGLEIRNGIWSGFNGTSYHHCILSDCVIHQIGPSSGTAVGIYVSTQPGSSDSSTHNLIQNNIIYDCAGEGIYVGNDADACPPMGAPCNHNIIRGNTIYRCEEGIDVKFGSRFNRIVNNRIYNGNGGKYSAGILVYEHTEIDSNTVFKNSNHGITVQGNHNRLLRNVIYDNGGMGIFVTGYESHWNAMMDSGDDNHIMHNTVVGNGGWGVYLYGGNDQDCRGTVIQNNIVMNNHEYQIVVEPHAVDGLVMEANNWFSSSGPVIRYAGKEYTSVESFREATGHGMHSMQVDPRFMDLDARRLHLQKTSPLIDRGVVLEFPYWGRAPDLGAFETPLEYEPLDEGGISAVPPKITARIFTSLSPHSRQLTVVLLASKKLASVPGDLILRQSDGADTRISLSGSVGGQRFSGILNLDEAVTEGPAYFYLEPGSLCDLEGNTGSVLTEGMDLYIDKTPPQIPSIISIHKSEDH